MAEGNIFNLNTIETSLSFFYIVFHLILRWSFVGYSNLSPQNKYWDAKTHHHSVFSVLCSFIFHSAILSNKPLKKTYNILPTHTHPTVALKLYSHIQEGFLNYRCISVHSRIPCPIFIKSDFSCLQRRYRIFYSLLNITLKYKYMAVQTNTISKFYFSGIYISLQSKTSLIIHSNLYTQNQWKSAMQWIVCVPQG